jgi:hypothetical protein
MKRLGGGVRNQASADMMQASWDSVRSLLQDEGWEEPDKGDAELWGKQLVGMKIYAMGYGAGEVKQWTQNRAQTGDGKFIV